jgi:hypothetical protein
LPFLANKRRNYENGAASCRSVRRTCLLRQLPYDIRLAEGGSQEQFRRDDAACRFEATKAPSSYPTGYLALDGRAKPLYELCMRSKGYTLKETK